MIASVRGSHSYKSTVQSFSISRLYTQFLGIAN